MDYCRVAPDVKLGKNVRLFAFVNLYGCEIGDESKIGTFVEIQKGSVVGRNCKISSHTFICEGVTIEDDVFLGPNAVLTNDPNPRAEVKKPREQWLPTLIRKGATIGANATVLCGLTVGRYAFVAAGSVVTRDVPDYALLVGVPGRLAGWMCRCGTRLQLADFAAICTHCGLRFKHTPAGLQEDTA